MEAKRSPSPGGAELTMPSRSSRIAVSLPARTNPATAKPTISSGTNDSTEKYVIAAA